MAKKEKEKKQKSKLLEVLTKDYKWENLLLIFLSIAALVVAMLIILDVLSIDENFPVLGQGNNGKIAAWVLLIISLLGVFLFLYPFITPAIPELRKIAWPTGMKFVKIATKVFIFIIIITTILSLFDLLGLKIISIIEEWRNV